MIEKYGYYDYSLVTTPYDPAIPLVKNTGKPVNQERYAQIIGSLMYLSNRTGHCLCCITTSRYTNNPDLSHWTALDRVFRYLIGTTDYCLRYSAYPSVLEGYSDANWISDSLDVKFTSGYVFVLGGSAISWRSTKQTILPRSTMEYELVALESTCSEAEWLKELLSDIPFVSQPIPPILIHCDSRSAIEFFKKKLINTKLSRHIKIRQKSVKKLESSSIVTIVHVSTNDNLADCLTKGLNRTKVLILSRGMGLSL